MSQLTSWRIGGSGSRRPGRKGDPAVLHLGAAGEAERVAHPERAAGLELLDDRRAAAEEGIAVALLLLPGDRLAQALIGRAIGRVDIVEIKAVGALANMRVHVDHGMAVPAHRILLSVSRHPRARLTRGSMDCRGEPGHDEFARRGRPGCPRRLAAASALAKSASPKP